MPHMRRDAWKLARGWNPTLLWYARGILALQDRKIDKPTSWRFLAAMHGFDTTLWQQISYLTASEPLPSAADQKLYWKQCQHQTWYFLPWHRGYLAAFEAIVRAAIVDLHGPADWAIPYWNYNDTSNPHARDLPDAFVADKLPDGTDNPLKVKQRFGTGDGTIVIRPRDIDLKPALTETAFVGTASASGGFGGPETLFHHGDASGSFGMLEQQPHNNVHTRVGGQIKDGDPNDGRTYGLMSVPDMAALDPIFWLHHANIDRLWEVWLRRDAKHRNPTEEEGWLTGPVDRKFAVPSPDGKPIQFNASDMLDTQSPKLDYVYEDVSDPLGGARRMEPRIARLAPAAAVPVSGMEESMARRQAAELLGANDATVQLTGAPVATQVRLDGAATAKLKSSFQAHTMFAAAAPQEPDRVFLNLEHVRGINDAAMFDVYVNLPPNSDPAAHPECFAGTVSLFGVAKASRGDAPHGGNGLNVTLEITDIVDALHLSNASLDHLNVQFVPQTTIRAADKISVERVSVYRQGR